MKGKRRDGSQAHPHNRSCCVQTSPSSNTTLRIQDVECIGDLLQCLGRRSWIVSFECDLTAETLFVALDLNFRAVERVFLCAGIVGAWPAGYPDIMQFT